MAEAATPAPKKEPLLRIGVHEFKTPLSVVFGYLRMLLTGRAGDLTASQRKMLEEIEKTTTRLHAIVEEMNELSLLEAGGATFNRGPVNIGALIENELGSLPPLPDREVQITVENKAPGIEVSGDPVKLRAALRALLLAHRRELVTSDELRVCVERATQNGSRMLRVTIAGVDRIEGLRQIPTEELTAFEEFRGGMGYAPAIARRIVTGHGGELFSPRADFRAGAILFLPEAQA